MQTQEQRNVTIVRAADGSVGLRFLRPNKVTIEVTELCQLALPNETAEYRWVTLS
jgi:hypothetical protein